LRIPAGDLLSLLEIGFHVNLLRTAKRQKLPTAVCSSLHGQL